jgi:hypothetical protein
MPLVCTNSSCGSVAIDPVILDPWIIHFSDVEATLTETPASPPYVTIGEMFNMTARACMPESWTGIFLNVTLPHDDGEGSEDLVTVNDAYVTFIGSELLNTTLMEGDTLSNSSNITLKAENTMIVFFFGPRVQIPDDNILIDDEQCFEIGLDCTVRNVPALVQGEQIPFEAVVETDNGVLTSRVVTSPIIAEPLLQFILVNPSGTYDAGDTAMFVVVAIHEAISRQTSAFRFVHSYHYATQFFYFNSSNSTSAQLFVNIALEANFTTNATIEDGVGTVPYERDEKNCPGGSGDDCETHPRT